MQDEQADRTISLRQEAIYVDKADVVTDQIRVTTTVEQCPVVIDEVVERGNLTVERRTVDRAVEQAPEPRQEGDTLIVSLVEERIVVEKRLFVVEELRITRTGRRERVTIPETVRTMHASVASGDLVGNIKQVAQETLKAGKDSAQTNFAGADQTSPAQAGS